MMCDDEYRVSEIKHTVNTNGIIPIIIILKCLLTRMIGSVLLRGSRTLQAIEAF